ncbi:MAG TPA: hypothetical protein VFL70_07240 [Bacteroidia bacterium]|nr:hypothetical protein [Bacteroidia bacterium]
METMIKSTATNISINDELSNATTVLTKNKVWEELEAARFAVTPMLLIIMACIGGVAAAYAVQGNEVMLLATAVSTMFVEILIVALAPMQMICLASAIALIIDFSVYFF